MNFKKVNNSFASMVVSQVYLLNCDISTKENGSRNYNTEGEETHGTGEKQNQDFYSFYGDCNKQNHCSFNKGYQR